ncbi:MAG: beta-ketoacyl-[acyl-carrier-protein] synthase family protein [bacterium]|nr:beta-ketoacyl-[acyl-carrier-protein] synthase family protein [bacterium]
MTPELFSGLPKEVEGSPRRIVVTGMGMVTPLGLNVEESWRKLIAGESGISPFELPVGLKIKVAGSIKNFDPEKLLRGLVDARDLRRISRPAQLALVASFEALQNAGLLNDDGVVDPKIAIRFGTQVGTGIGGAYEIAMVREKVLNGRRISPFDTLRIELERVATVVSMKFGLKGPIETPTAACATGNIAIVGGWKEIRLGEADLMLCGGVESSLNEVTISLFDSMGAMSRNENPQSASRPFDKKRDGFVMGEGAGVLILEEYNHACRRGARILAELVGYANTADAAHDTNPSGEGAVRAMRGATKKAGVVGGDIYINTHGTSTPTGDLVEIKAIKEVFPDHSRVVASSTKGAMGHTMGAAGAIESIISIKALGAGIIPPTLNLTDPIGEAEGLDLVPNQARKQRVDAVINNAFGFGGINSVIVFRRGEEQNLSFPPATPVYSRRRIGTTR